MLINKSRFSYATTESNYIVVIRVYINNDRNGPLRKHESVSQATYFVVGLYLFLNVHIERVEIYVNVYFLISSFCFYIKVHNELLSTCK